MWFFRTFCLKYGGKGYPPVPQVDMNPVEGVGDAFGELIIFARIGDLRGTRRPLQRPWSEQPRRLP